MKTLTRPDPWRELEDMFDRHAKTFGQLRPGISELAESADWIPVVDIAETEKEFVIQAEIPGVEKNDVKVTVDRDVLTIQGKRESEKEEKGRKFHRIERSYGSFTRSFSLPENVDESHVHAAFRDGMLKLTLRKTAEEKPKLIEVKVE